MLGKELDWEFLDADSLHSEANIAKMQSGQPLNDQDRLPWLESCNHAMRQCVSKITTGAHMRRWKARQTSAILACSSLKRSYRKLLSAGLADEIQFVLIKVSVWCHVYI